MFSQIFLLMHLLYPPKQMLIAWVFHPFYSLSLLTLIPLIRLLDFWTNFFYLMSSFCMANLSFDCFWYYASPSAFWTRSWVTSLFPDVSLGYSMYCMNCSIHLSGNLEFLLEIFGKREGVMFNGYDLVLTGAKMKILFIISLISYTNFQNRWFSEFYREKYYLFSMNALSFLYWETHIFSNLTHYIAIYLALVARNRRAKCID